MSAGRAVTVRRIALLVLVFGAAAWSAALTFGGGVTLHAPWGRVSSRDPIRPLAIAIAAGVLFTFLDPNARAAIRGPHARVWASRVALLIAALAVIGGVRFGTFTASGSDPSGYVSEAALWREGALIRAAPGWVATATWPRAEFTAAPLGYLPGPTRDTQVPAYPPGFPLLMALAHTVGGTNGEYYVVPIAAGILVWAAFMLGVRLAGPWGGLLTASLMASSPPFLMWLVMPMSDLPVAACWTVAWVCALAGTVAAAFGAGAATALAVAIRPNLAPLAAIVALVVALQSQNRLRALTGYIAMSGTGVLLLAVVNNALYGSPLRSGYGDLRALYSLDFLWPNIQRYGSWFLATQTAIPLVGLVAALLILRGARRPVVLAITAGVPVLVVCMYLPYRPFEDWSYLRFLLPAYPPLFAGLAVAIVEAERAWGRSNVIRFGVAAGIAVLTIRGVNYSNAPADLAATEPRYRHVAVAAASTARANAVFVAFQHSGSLRYYTGRDILRWDLMDRAGIDAALDHLAANGHQLYWVGEAVERDLLQRQLDGTRFLTRVQTGRRQVIDGIWVVDLMAGE